MPRTRSIALVLIGVTVLEIFQPAECIQPLPASITKVLQKPAVVVEKRNSKSADPVSCIDDISCNMNQDQRISQQPLLQLDQASKRRNDPNSITAFVITPDTESVDDAKLLPFLQSLESSLLRGLLHQSQGNKQSPNSNTQSSQDGNNIKVEGASDDKSEFKRIPELYKKQSSPEIRRKREVSRLLPRQVDLMHTCIEAKCSSIGSHGYMDCVYHHCIAFLSGFLVSKRKQNFGYEDKMAEAEEVYQTHPADYSNFITSSDNSLQGFPNGGDLSAGENPNKSARGNLFYGLRSVGDALKKNIQYRGLADFKDGGDKGKKLDRIRSGELDANKRAYNDIADLCVRHHCGDVEHTVDYFRCKNNCAGKRA